ncbi:hypothetical protein EG329_007511 [Mollisiaceae sp. DMI_Dod_QoI]|nr:hypothetical protein EG329_007511 [Helotiales sp. DMI_Dod_QoI]
MASLNTSTNGPSIKSSYQGVVNSAAPSGAAANSPTYGQWAIFSVSAPLVNAFQQDSGGKESVLKVQGTGEGELIDLIEDFSEGRVQFAFVKVKDPNTTLPKYVLIGWGYHVQITARSDRDLTPENIVQKVADASGAKYSSGSAPPPQSSGPPPPLASKPVFNPTRSSGTSGFNPLASSRSRQNAANVDDDGWGADAPPVTRSQLEKVQPAYQPTKINMAELTKQKPEPPRFNGSSRTDENIGADVVKGGYQPIGKVDIAALRAQAKSSGDDRPTIVKGAYEPVGKVDIAAIKARAQKPSDDGPRELSPAATGTSATSDEPKSLAERSAAFSQSERLTSLPKPKVANRFGSNASNFTGTKAPTPGAFGLQSAPATALPPPIGAASRTFANEGGKTPQQIWQEKKARERGLSGAGNITPGMTSPIKSQTSGGGEWKSGYSGKSWAPVATNPTGRSGTGSIGQQRTGEEEYEQEAPASPAGGISAIRDRFKGGAPMGAPSMARSSTGEQSPPPPPINMSTRPVGGISMPGLPSRPRPQEDDEEEQSRPNIPPPPAVPRSPTPEPEEEEQREPSPVRLAMPVSRSKEPEMEAPEELHPPPALPTYMGRNVPQEAEPEEEPEGHDTARGAGAAMAQASFGQQAATTNQGSHASGKRALIQYDYEKAEDNELELTEGEYVTNIEMVDDDWWMGTNSKGESGLFPSNYVELVEDDEAPAQHEPEPEPAPAQAPRPAAAPAAAATAGPTATAIYDYEAAEDNELSFDEGATITSLEFPDEDWWFGHFRGKSGLFPANYVQLDD